MEQQVQHKFVTRESIVADVVAKYPDVVPILLSYGLHCVGCHVSTIDTIEAGCSTHGMGDDEIDALLRDVNEFIEQNGLVNKTQEKENAEIKPVEVTLSAVSKLKELMKKENKEGFGLRVRVVPGGCSGFSYELDFEKQPEKEDLVYDKNEIKVFIDHDSAEIMNGAKIDFVDGLHGTGFKVENPNAKSSCGCGKSFR